MADLHLGPAEVNLVDIVANDSWSLTMTITQNGSAMDLTGQQIDAAIKAGAVKYPLAVTVTNPTGGQLTIGQSDAPEYGTYGATWAMRIGGRTYMAGTASGIQDILA